MKDHLPTLAVLLLAAFLLFFNLGSSSLHSWGKAEHALVAREVLDTGQWRTPPLSRTACFLGRSW